jgi:glycosyltransferase involved in cell wall biosynthesis
MKILQIHNYYQQAGGEDTVVALEKNLLEKAGHEVISYYRNNKEIETYPLYKKANLFRSVIFNKKSYLDVRDLLAKEKPDLCHIHNILPLVSGSVFMACIEADLPIVHTLHNFRYLCANGLFYRAHHACEDCLKKSAYQGFKHACYRESKIQTLSVIRLNQFIKKGNILNYPKLKFLVFSEFARQKFIDGGFPAEKLMIKPNFVFELQKPKETEQLAFVGMGRVERAKGIETFKKLALQFPAEQFEWIGSGLDEDMLKDIPNLSVTGQINRDEAMSKIAGSKGLLFTSLMYEGMPMSVVEALSLAKPIVAFDTGARRDLVHDGHNGFLYKDDAELFVKFKLLSTNPALRKQFGERSREIFNEKFTAEKNIALLEGIYQDLVQIKS